MGQLVFKTPVDLKLFILRKKMKNFTLICITISFLLLIFCKQEVDGLFFGRPRTTCSSNRQCRYGCRKVTNVFCSAGNLIRGLFRRKGRSCSGYQCRECISDSNCSYNKYCSGGSCLSRGSSCSSSSQCSGSQSCRGGSCSY